MRPAPARLAEAIVGFLLPPACREEVLGDLHERHTSARQYVIDAACTVPLVIGSRIRRTNDAVVFLMEAFILYVAFLVAAWRLSGPPFLYEQMGFFRIAIPVIVVLIASMLRNAYTNPKAHSPLKLIQGVSLTLGFAFLAQAVVVLWKKDLALPPLVMLSGGAASLLLLPAFRLLFPPIPDRPDAAGIPAYWQKQSMEAIGLSRHSLRRMAQFWTLKDYALAAVVIVAMWIVHELRK